MLKKLGNRNKNFRRSSTLTNIYIFSRNSNFPRCSEHTLQWTLLLDFEVTLAYFFACLKIGWQVMLDYAK